MRMFSRATKAPVQAYCASASSCSMKPSLELDSYPGVLPPGTLIIAERPSLYGGLAGFSAFLLA